MFDLEGEFRLEEITRPTLFVKIKVKFLWPSGDSLQCQVGGCESGGEVDVGAGDVGQTRHKPLRLSSRGRLQRSVFIPEKLVESYSCPLSLVKF